jgi:transcription elongation factor GreA
MSQINYYTEEGLKKLKDELYELTHVQRPSISNQIAEARDKGDLSENAEYDAAKEAQGILEMRIAKLESVIANARLIDDTLIKSFDS